MPACVGALPVLLLKRSNAMLNTLTHTLNTRYTPTDTRGNAQKHVQKRGQTRALNACKHALNTR